jgi:TB2/DP1, HVA22 family
MYWITFGSLHIAETFLSFLQRTRWGQGVAIYYFPCKLLFLVWCIRSNGATTVYQKLLRPYFVKHQDDAETIIKHVGNYGSQAISEIGQISSRAMGQYALGAVDNMIFGQPESDDAPKDR